MILYKVITDPLQDTNNNNYNKCTLLTMELDNNYFF